MRLLLVSGWVQADEAAVEAMQEYLILSEFEAGIILPNQIQRCGRSLGRLQGLL